ncbi:hypothetical protein KFL_001530030 [Klebsormidium nitens]|uniref:HAT C-terminal dimerisation domain-containing protein n=1 Tax=Klebsormidium nitens TaxID=105231 RepID=A0A1Y1HY12_KLENI|nr:hypothetical protein KFL_001530030 [Klebsormidium nitens]|eukprot:GAQ83560.1 hypothetical protein KFL_001530030 [Klebsormidium nitens]
MFDITPHAGGVERVFSMMGWMQNDKRNRLRTDTLEMMAKVKTYHQSLQTRVAPPKARPSDRAHTSSGRRSNGCQPRHGSLFLRPNQGRAGRRPECRDRRRSGAHARRACGHPPLLLRAGYVDGSLDEQPGNRLLVEDSYDLDDPLFGPDPLSGAQSQAAPCDYGASNEQFSSDDVINQFLNSSGGDS